MHVWPDVGREKEGEKGGGKKTKEKKELKEEARHQLIMH